MKLRPLIFSLALALIAVGMPEPLLFAQTPLPTPATGIENYSGQQPINLGDENPGAGGANAGQGVQPDSLTATTLKMIGALGLVLCLIAAIAWFAKKHMPTARRAMAGPDAISVLSVRSLGPRRSLIVVRVKGRCLLLGATPSAITRLADLDMPPGSEPEPGEAASFDSELASFIQKPS